VRIGDEWRQIRFHAYDELFSVPGLYEKVIYEILECNSPEVVTSLLSQTLRQAGESPRDLRVLDLGAGNGIVGELLAERKAEFLVGVDIIEEAAHACERDRPGLYDNYHIVDLTDLSDAERRELAAYRFNCLTCVAALGFGDIPVEAFTTAYNLIQREGWIVFNIKERFLDDDDESGFGKLIRSMVDEGAMDIRRRRRYQHRLGTDREPLDYVAIVARKKRHID
jgi:predicted TPR repeat methyltransferase